jgi:diketogulonate reductase-like aldo/keto reductase
MLVACSVVVMARPATVKLNTGYEMPMVGIGTAASLGRESVKVALESGYRLIDTAQAVEWYREDEAGSGMHTFLGGNSNTGSLTREDIFVTTKMHPRNLGFEATLAAFKTSPVNLKTDYVDLFMLHYPRCWMCENKEPEGTFLDSWRAMEKLAGEGKIRSLGVSNFEVSDLEELWHAAIIKPAVVQNWMDPFHQDKPTQEWCETHGVHYQAYSRCAKHILKDSQHHTHFLAKLPAFV